MIRNILRRQQGSISIITALAFTVLLGFAALAIDIGLLYMNKAQLSNLTDAAALAGVQDLPADTQQAVNTARDYALKNGNAEDVLEFYIPNEKTIRVSAKRKVGLFFAHAINIDFSEVHAGATAALTPISGVNGVVPFGVVKQDFIYGQSYKLKLGPGEGYNGNFAALALGGTGATNYRDNIKTGYQGKLEIVEWVPLLLETEPGNMSGPTADGVNYRIDLDKGATFDSVQKGSPRIVVVPVIDSLDGNGRSSVQVDGFAAFFLESVGGSGVDSYVTGKFMNLVVSGDISGSGIDYGVYAARLIK